MRELGLCCAQGNGVVEMFKISLWHHVSLYLWSDLASAPDKQHLSRRPFLATAGPVHTYWVQSWLQLHMHEA